MRTVRRYNLKFPLGIPLIEIAAEIIFFFARAKAKVIAHQITDASDNKELALWKLKSFILMKMHLNKLSGNHRVTY